MFGRVFQTNQSNETVAITWIFAIVPRECVVLRICVSGEKILSTSLRQVFSMRKYQQKDFHTYDTMPS